MNIFVLHESPVRCAQMHCDRHVVKMILEYGQLLTAAHRVLDGHNGIINLQGINKSGPRRYAYVLPREDGKVPELPLLTHPNHPCAVWARRTTGNYDWLLCLFLELLREYTYRYGRTHTWQMWVPRLMEYPHAMVLDEAQPRSEFVQAMPEVYKQSDAVDAYRAYYLGAKRDIMTYRRREVPLWAR